MCVLGSKPQSSGRGLLRLDFLMCNCAVKNKELRPGEIVQKLRTLDALPKEQSSVPNTLWVASSSLELQLPRDQHTLLASVGNCTHIFVLILSL